MASEGLYYTYASILKNPDVRSAETDQLMKANMDNVVAYISKTITEKAAPTSVGLPADSGSLELRGKFVD